LTPAEAAKADRAGDSGISLPEACEEAIASNIRALGTVGIKFAVQREYRVPGLPRPKRDDIYIYLDSAKFYQRRVRTLPSPTGGGDQEIEQEMAFDGTVFYLGHTGKVGAPRLLKMLGDNAEDPQARNTFTSCPYLDAAGFSLPRTVRQWKESTLVSTVLQMTSVGTITDLSTEGSTLALILRIREPYVTAAKQLDLDQLSRQMQQGGATEADIKNRIKSYRRVISLDWFRQVEIWLDTEKGFALRRRKDSNPEGRVIQTIECRHFRYTKRANLWLPWKCTVTTYVKSPELFMAFTDEPNETDRIELHELTFKPRKDVTFKLDYGTGTLVTDRSTKAAKASRFGGTSYVIPSGKENLRAQAGHWRSIFFALNFIVLLVLVLVLLYRGRRRATC